MSFLRKLFGFKGRLRRRDWWLFSILIAVAQTAVLQTYLVNVLEQPFREFSAPNRDPVVVVSLIAFWWPTLAIAVQRFHDRDRNAWPVFLFYAVMLAVQLAPSAWLSLTGVSAIYTGAVFLLIPISLWFLIMLGFADGTRGPNRFGPSPKRVEPVQD